MSDLPNIREALGYNQGQAGGQYLGGAIPVDKESLSQKLDRVEKEFYQYREMNEQRQEKMHALITQIVNYVGMK